MKRNTLKGWIPTTGLALVLTFGATFANAGATVNGSPIATSCTETSKDGILVTDRSIIDTIKSFFEGILVTDSPKAGQCTEKNGATVNG